MFRLIRRIKNRIFWTVIGIMAVSLGGIGMLSSCSNKDEANTLGNDSKIKIELDANSANIQLGE